MGKAHASVGNSVRDQRVEAIENAAFIPVVQLSLFGAFGCAAQLLDGRGKLQSCC